MKLFTWCVWLTTTSTPKSIFLVPIVRSNHGKQKQQLLLIFIRDRNMIQSTPRQMNTCNLFDYFLFLRLRFILVLIFVLCVFLFSCFLFIPRNNKQREPLKFPRKSTSLANSQESRKSLKSIVNHVSLACSVLLWSFKKKPKFEI